MKVTRRISNALVTGACAVLGGVHFVAQTSADVVSSAEAHLLQRRDGSELEHIKKERMYKTVSRQQHILEKVEAFQNAVKEAKDRIAGIEHYDTPEHLSTNLTFVTAEVITGQ